MAKQLSLDEQIISAAKLAVRARVHCGLWWTTASAAGRSLFHDALDEDWAAWRFVEHAQFVAFMVTTHNLYGDRRGTIRFKILSAKLDRVASDLISEATPIAAKVRQFRDQLFAHRSDKLPYDEIFRRAEITANQMTHLAELSVEIAANMLEARGLPEHPADDVSIEALGRILAKLQRQYDAEG